MLLDKKSSVQELSTEVLNKNKPGEGQNKRELMEIFLRGIFLFISVIIGFYTSLHVYDIELSNIINEVRTSRDERWPTVFLGIATIPTLFLLWVFRTYDIKQQISQARKNEYLGRLSEGLKLLFTPVNTNQYGEAVESKKIQNSNIRIAGLIMLLNLKRSGYFSDIIDIATSSKIELSNGDLRGANLRGANLNFAIFKDTLLNNANLSGAMLLGSSLNTYTLDKAILNGAKYILEKTNPNQEEQQFDPTDFPPGFDPVKHKMELFKN